VDSYPHPEFRVRPIDWLFLSAVPFFLGLELFYLLVWLPRMIRRMHQGTRDVFEAAQSFHNEREARLEEAIEELRDEVRRRQGFYTLDDLDIGTGQRATSLVLQHHGLNGLPLPRGAASVEVVERPRAPTSFERVLNDDDLV
jgi:hypothetical protein